MRGIEAVAELHIRDLTRDGVDRVYYQNDINLTKDTISTLNFNLGEMKPWEHIWVI